MRNIKDLVDICKTTVETVGDVTVCKELPESTLEVVNEMIRVLFYKEENACEALIDVPDESEVTPTKVALTKEDLLKGDWWCSGSSSTHEEALFSLGLSVYASGWSKTPPTFFYMDSQGDIVRIKDKNHLDDYKEIELINGSFYYV